ncbi:MAG: DUF3035 domain-containing protein [Rhodospirillaceae bacterium]|nr:DUF3035 domain-containing protein [Rhodospirillaceae bacterium]
MNFFSAKATSIICLIVAAGIVAGCADTRRNLIKEKAAPDEFQVYKRAPLSMPPDFGLRPPAAPGTEVRAEDDPTTQARIVITGRQAPVQVVNSSTPGLAAIYLRTGVGSAEPNIRNLVDNETSAFAVENISVMESLMFGDDIKYGTTVDAAKEAERIRENQAKGAPINEGEIPKIERKEPRLLDGVFN